MLALQVVIQLLKEPRRLPRGSYLNELYPNLCESPMSGWCSKEATINHLCKGPPVDIESLSVRDDHTLWIIRYVEMLGESVNGRRTNSLGAPSVITIRFMGLICLRAW